MNRINFFCLAFAAILLSLPLAASAKVNCESLESMIDVPDDQCAAISDSARRCFTDLNLELSLIKRTKDKQLRSRAASELTADYEREIENWLRNYDYIKDLGEGRACLNETAEVEAWIIEMKRDKDYLKKRRY